MASMVLLAHKHFFPEIFSEIYLSVVHIALNFILQDVDESQLHRMQLGLKKSQEKSIF